MIFNRTGYTTRNHVDRSLRALIFQLISLQIFAVFMVATFFTGFGLGRVLASGFLIGCFIYTTRATALLFRHGREPHDQASFVLSWLILTLAFFIFFFGAYIGVQYVIRG